MPYRFSILRFVPDPARGEFVNIGAVAGNDDARDWEVRQIQSLRRANAIDDKARDQARLPYASAFTARIEEHIAAVDQLQGCAVEPMSAALLARWADEMHNVVQFSPPAPIVADSAASALDLVFSELIVDQASKRLGYQTKRAALARTRQAYRDYAVPEESIAQRATVVAGPYDAEFDFVVFNGQVVQLAQCWSFQTMDQPQLAEEVKAWAWVVRELRTNSGVLRIDARELVVPGRDVEIASVCIPPADEQDAHAYNEAKAAFNETQVTQLTVDRAGEVGQVAAQRLGISA